MTYNLTIKALDALKDRGFTFTVEGDAYSDTAHIWAMVEACEELYIRCYKDEVQAGTIWTSAYGLEMDENMIDYGGSPLFMRVIDNTVEELEAAHATEGYQVA